MPKIDWSKLKTRNKKERNGILKVLSLFSGIGAFEKALKRTGVNYELVGFSEIDKYATKSYCAIHDESENKNLGDITKIDLNELPQNIDLVTHGSPCQDFSLAGKQAGGDEGSKTRSSLMWNTVKIIECVKPKYVIWENVRNLLSKKHKHNFEKYIEVLNDFGYNSYYEILNAKDYGIPQNRERVFTVSIRKDIDKGSFLFPEKEELKLKLKDMLEKEVDEKYYLSDQQIAKLTFKNEHEINLNYYNYDEMNRVYSEDYICPALRTMQGGSREPKIFIKNATKQGYAEACVGDSINFERPDSETRRGRVGKQVAQTLNCACNQGVVIGSSILLSYPSTPKNRIKKDIARCITTVAEQGVFTD